MPKKTEVIIKDWKSYIHCKICKELKELNADNFYRNCNHILWYEYWCRECMSKIQKKRQATIKSKDAIINRLIWERNYREEKYRALDLEVMKRFGIHL